jgi:DNA-binding winged helix-turn-helix (wHTH) protein/TolB-like protein/Tfp pilus assembly protein PilF
LYEFGTFRFDPDNHLLLSDGSPVSLTPKAFDILLVLVQNGGRLTTKEELMRRVWPDSFVEEANLTVNISILRKLLGESDEGQTYIETVPKKGYRFVAPVREITEEPPAPVDLVEDRPQRSVSESGAQSEGVSSRAPLQPPSLPRDKSWTRFSIPAIGALLIVLVGLYYFTDHFRTFRFHRSSQSRRLAILPFQNLRKGTENDFLCFSLADAIITKLGYISEVAVRPSYAVQKYKTAPIDLRRIASELNVDTLLMGTFLREGDDVRITCQLIDVATENVLWKGNFQLKYDKLLTLQDSVTDQIIKGLELTLSPSEAAQLKTVEAINPDAYEYFLRGIDLYSNNDFPMAIKMFEKSTELAPDYALTWAHLGKSYTANASFQFGGGEQYQKAQQAFEHALSLQPDQLDARIYMANMFTDTGRVEKAVPLLREALKTNPNHPEIHWELGYAYRFAGMLQESVAESENARRLDPGVKLNSSTLNGYLYLGQYDRFLESLPKANDPALIAFYRGFGEFYEKRWQEAADDFDHAMELDPTLYQAQIGKALGFGIHKRIAEGLTLLHQVEAKINDRGVGDAEALYKIAQAFAVLGDEKSALRVLKNSIESGFFSYPYFLTDPLLDSIRNNPEFDKLMSVARQRHDAFVKSFF